MDRRIWYMLNQPLLTIIIHQIFSLARDWSKHVTWPNIPQPKLGDIRVYNQILLLARDWSKHITWPNITQLKLEDIREYPPIFKSARVAKKVWRIINTIASIWGENMLRYLPLDIICSSKLTVFLELQSRTQSTDKYPSIFSCQMEDIKWRLLFIHHLRSSTSTL